MRRLSPGETQMAYQINTFDVCTQGFERLRNQDEFILTAIVESDTSADSIREQWLENIQCCDRGDDFDYQDAKDVVEIFWKRNIAPLFSKPNPFNLEPVGDDVHE